MALVNEGGSLRVVNGALGTGQACCCKIGKCSGPCETCTDCGLTSVAITYMLRGSGPNDATLSTASHGDDCSFTFEIQDMECLDGDCPSKFYRVSYTCDPFTVTSVEYDAEASNCDCPEEVEILTVVPNCEPCEYVCPEGCVCVDGECVELVANTCNIFEAYNPDTDHGWYCSRAEAVAGSLAQATEQDCAANLGIADDPDCTFVSATGDEDDLCGLQCLINPDTGDPECPEYWANIVTCCYYCEENPLP